MYATTYRTAAEINQSMGRVYFNMFLAVMTSMLVSYLVGSSPAALAFFFTGITKWVVIFAPLVFIFLVPILFNAGIGPAGAQLVLHAFAALMGLSMATVFAVFTGLSIFSAFIGAGTLFGVMSVYGYFTKTSLDSIGKYLFVALIAIIIVSLINIFIGSSVVAMAISAAAVLIFLGLTAYDTQKIREQLMEDPSYTTEVYGSLTLYLDFINLFINLLNLFGVKKD